MANIFSKHRNKMRQQAKKAAKAQLSAEASKLDVDQQTSDCLEQAGEGVDQLPDGLITCEILSLSHEGRGIAKNKGKTQFVLQALPGETVLASITAHKAKYDELVSRKVLQASAQRVEPACPHFGECGGCSLQHLEHGAQVSHKQSVLAEQLQHFGSIQPQQWLPAVVGKSWGYRARCRLSIDAQSRALRVGFRKRGSKEILGLNQCPILDVSVASLMPELKALIAKLSSPKLATHIELSVHEHGVAMLLRHVKPLNDNDQCRLIEFVKAKQWSLFLQPGDASTTTKVWPEDDDDFISYRLNLKDALQLYYLPKDFTQINPEVNQKMVSLALQALDIRSDERVLDLFSGLGNFTLAMAQQAKHAVGIEGSQEMVERGKMNASRNNIDNADFYEANLYGSFDKAEWAQADYDKILIDPPRAGAAEVVSIIARFKAQRIVYISCNPATLARDAGALIQQGYRLSQAGILDMFPHTDHVESIAIFDREQ